MNDADYTYLENNISIKEYMEWCKSNGITCAYKDNLYDSIVDGLLEMSIDKAAKEDIVAVGPLDRIDVGRK